MEILMIRHFKTQGNRYGRYIGVTDEDILCDSEFNQQVKMLHKKLERCKSIEAVYCSPLKRCVQTGKALFPELELQEKEGFMECDFGDFENKNYLELSENSDYQAWVDSGGKIVFPGGEDPKEFRVRCGETFQEVIKECICKEYQSIALVVHGGTIMSILERFANEGNTFYDYQRKNGEGYTLLVEPLPKEKQSGEVPSLFVNGTSYWIESVETW